MRIRSLESRVGIKGTQAKIFVIRQNFKPERTNAPTQFIIRVKVIMPTLREIVRYIYRGGLHEDIRDDATHIIVDESVKVIQREAFWRHLGIVELICHDEVEKIEAGAFFGCKKLRRVVMPGVKLADIGAFGGCRSLTDVECGKLERIEGLAFDDCKSLRSINLPSARIIGGEAFCGCTSLERITIPLRDGLITADDIFQGCRNLNHVDLVEGEVHEVIAALHFEEWRNDMHKDIDTINHILPNANTGQRNRLDNFNDDISNDVGEKARAIRRWIRSVLRKIIHYEAEHHQILNEAGPALNLVLHGDIVMNNILPFLELPSHMFEVEVRDHEDGESDCDEEESEDEEGEDEVMM